MGTADTCQACSLMGLWDGSTACKARNRRECPVLTWLLMNGWAYQPRILNMDWEAVWVTPWGKHYRTQCVKLAYNPATGRPEEITVATIRALLFAAYQADYERWRQQPRQRLGAAIMDASIFAPWLPAWFRWAQQKIGCWIWGHYRYPWEGILPNG